jgi:hypothetical protein
VTAISQTFRIPGARAHRRAGRALSQGIAAGLVLAAIGLSASTLGMHGQILPQPDSAWSGVRVPRSGGSPEISHVLAPLPLSE